MAISIRREFGGDLAKLFLDDLQFQRSKYYYFLGGTQPWTGVGGEGSLDQPPAIEADVSAEADRRIRSEILFAKQISPNDISFAVRRIVWTENTVYDKWDNTLDMTDKNFYVISSDNHVYKCLDNGSLFGETPNASFEEPNIVSLYPFTTIDGYVWKYLYTVTPYFRSRFSSPEFMPVKRAISETFYNNGSIDSVAVVNEGSGYLDAQLTFINVSGPTTGSGAVATLITNVVGTITGATIVNPGSGYTNGVRVAVDSLTGAGAILSAVTNVAGEITGITIQDGGIGYDNSDTVNFVLGGAIVIPVISRIDGSILEARIIDPGVGYSANPTLEVVTSTGQGAGAYGNPTALLQGIAFGGELKFANIIDPGIGYPVDTDTTITVQGDGTGAQFSPLIYEEKIIDVIVENPGSGYTNSILTVNSTFGSGAILRGVITPSDFESRQAVVEQTAIPGAIYAVEVTNGGSGYSASTTVEVRGNGTGARVSPVIVFGQIKRINVIDFGRDYTSAEIVIIDPTRPDEEILEESRARAYPILPPVGGHGKDAPSELLCTTVVINTPLRGDISAQQVVQDYRLFGIIKNPTNIFTGSRYNSLSSLLTYTMRAQDTTFLSKDQIFVFENNKYRVVDFTIDTVSLLPLDRDTVIPLGILTRIDNSSIQMITTEARTSFDMDKYSGRLLYVSSDPPFEFNEEQSITIKTFITF